MPTDVCLMRSTASAISCLMVMTRLFFSSFWICSAVSAYRVLSCTDVMTANAKTCLPWAGVNVSDVLAPLLHIDRSLYSGLALMLGATANIRNLCPFSNFFVAT